LVGDGESQKLLVGTGRKKKKKTKVQQQQQQHSREWMTAWSSLIPMMALLYMYWMLQREERRVLV
jgi:hypothetical protein